MKSTLLILLVLMAVAGGTFAQAPRQNMMDLQTAPRDTIDAKNLRIWLPLERENRCWLNVEIFDESGRVVRHLISRMAPKGYYNYYWNKRDDSGKLVDAGVYTYQATDCGRNYDGELTVQYKEWERKNIAEIQKQRRREWLWLQLLDDSARVTIEMFDYHWRPIDVPIKDSLMNEGKYRFDWKPADTVLAGRYYLRLTVGDHVQDLKLTYRKKR